MRRVPIVTRIAVVLAALVVFSSLVSLNWRTYNPGGAETADAQLRFLESSLENGAAERMQLLFPEGYVFTWALYGLASAQVAQTLSEGSPRRIELINASANAVERVLSDKAKSTFEPELTPSYGAYYASWALYVRSVLLRTVGTDGEIPFDMDLFERDCLHFALAYRNGETPFLPTYTGMAWPADNAVGIAALAIRDQVLNPSYSDVVDAWVTATKERLDPELGAIRFADGELFGMPNDGPRGESLALLSIILADIDAEFALSQYKIMREHFVDYVWGIPGVREYPHGVVGDSDVDSGPIVFGYSGPATAVGAGAAIVFGDDEIATAMLATAEVVGLPIEVFGKRRYIFGKLPVGDAFLAWARTVPEVSIADSLQFERVLPRFWRLPLQLVSLIVGACFVWLLIKVMRGSGSTLLRRGKHTGD